MEVLKFKSIGPVGKFRFYPVSSIKKVTHTIAGNGSESLTITFDQGLETLTVKKDVDEVLKILNSTFANKNQIKNIEDAAKAARKKNEDLKAAQEKARIARQKKSEEIRAAVLKKNAVKKAPVKKTSKKAGKKVTKKKAKTKKK